MKQSLRLSIPTPCSEDWERMLPAERGRHCEQCCKTVVDFSAMSDGEVLRFFKEHAGGGAKDGGVEATGGVCGRFASDQLGRELAPAPVQRNGVKGWPWVMAGAMMIGQGPDGGGTNGGSSKKAGVEVRQGEAAIGRRFTGKPMLQADTAVPVVKGTTTVVSDSSSVDMGIPEVTVGEVEEHRVCLDTAELPSDTVVGWQIQKARMLTGLVGVMPKRTADSVKCLDTVSPIKFALDTIASVVKDTVAAVVSAFRSEEGVKVFPNPVTRGGSLGVVWNGAGGRYQVALVSVGGTLVQERMVEVAGKGQVDEWQLPGGLAAGVYFLRFVRPGEKGYMVEILVQ